MMPMAKIKQPKNKKAVVNMPSTKFKNWNSTKILSFELNVCVVIF